MNFLSPLFFLWVLPFFSGAIPAVTVSPVPTPIVSVDTGVPVLIGYTQKAATPSNSSRSRAVLVSSLPEYERLFGGATAGYYLWESVRLFFQNGGNRCFVLSVGTTTQAPDRTGLLKGLEISRQTPAQLLLVPDAVALPTADFYRVQDAMMDLCAELGDRFAILNTRAPVGKVSQDLHEFRRPTVSVNRSWAAVYYPWLLNDQETLVPPAGAVAGIYAQTDATKGVWKAPANVRLRGVKALSHALSVAERELATQSPSDGKSVNPIVEFPGKGMLVWGARTLAGNDNEWRYVSVRRMAILLDNSIRQGLGWAVFEPNQANLWSSVEAGVTDYLQGLWRQGALQGTKPDHAFYVRCGLGQTMTAQDILDKKLIIELGFAPLKPAEFVIRRLEFRMR